MSAETPNWQRFDRRERLGRFGVVLLSAVIVVASWRWLALDLQYVGSAPAEMGDLFARMFPPDVGYTGEIVAPLIETIHIAVVGTIAAVALSIPVAFMAAENTAPTDSSTASVN